MSKLSALGALVVCAVALGSVGCASPATRPVAPSVPTVTAHLSSKDGSELDIFVEDKDGPFALSATQIDAVARVAEGDQIVLSLSFSCAPASERPANEPEGTCSHYVASAPWIQPESTMRLAMALPVGERQVPMVWRDFQPKAYVQHED